MGPGLQASAPLSEHGDEWEDERNVNMVLRLACGEACLVLAGLSRYFTKFMEDAYHESKTSSTFLCTKINLPSHSIFHELFVAPGILLTVSIFL